MKKQAVMALMILSLMVALAVTPATAQSNSHFMRITIPFEFVVRGDKLPPGEYIVKRSSSGSTETLLIKGVDDGSGQYVLTSNVPTNTRQRQSKLIFQQYGDQYFLSQVWTAGDSAGRELPKSGRERVAGREMAKNMMERRTVTLIAHQR